MGKEHRVQLGGPSPTTSLSLTRKYRPRRFSEVFGQGHAVKLLSELILRGRRRNILLYGAIGSGKTTLARIYGRALGCLKREADGSPCCECENCLSYIFNESDGTTLGKEEIKVLLKSHGPGRVIFIDEAHAIDNGSIESLLKPLENRAEMTVILATSKADKIPRPVRSRFLPIEFRPLSFGKSVEFLRLIAAKENIECENDALRLIAADSDGQARDLLQRLDQARFDEKVTLSTVRDQLGISFSESLVAYLTALAEGAIAQQAQRYYEWDDDSSVKLRLIQNFIFSAFARGVAQLPVDVDPSLSAISEAARSEIIGRWVTRVGADVFPQYLKSLIAFWPVLPTDISDAAVNLYILRFHELVNAKTALGATAKSLTTHAQKSEYGNRPLPPPNAPDPNYLSNEEVKRIINIATRMVQAYGVRFNARITLWHRAFGFEDIAGAAENTKAFNTAIRQHLKQPKFSSGYRLSVDGSNAEKGYWTRIAAVVPADKCATIGAILDKWRTDKRDPKQSKAIDWELIPPGSKPDVFHCGCVRWLCGGVDPKTMVHVDDGTQTALVDLLKIPKDFRQSFGIVGSRRITCTEALSEKTFLAQTEFKMAFLLPFDCQEWEHVCGKWQVDEYQARVETIAARREALESAAHASSSASEREAAMREVLEQWNDDPRERPRSWHKWWQSAAF